MPLLKNKKILFLTAIFLITSITRLFKLADYPVSLNVDEVSIGYDAFSILNTGRDHYGKAFPLIFESIGDYKNGVYIYMVTASEAIFGVNELAVRLPSAIFGIIFVFVVFYLSKRLFTNTRIPYILALLTSISPWHIRLSRGGYEANVALTLLFLGIFLFLRNIDKKKNLILPVILMISSAYTYHSEKILVPIILVFLFVIYYKEIVSNTKKLWLQLFVIFLFSIPMIFSVFGKNQDRNSTVLANKDPEIIVISKDSKNFSNFDNKYLMIYSSLRRYFQYLDPSFLFIRGLEFTQHTNLNQGVFYLIEIPFFVFGFVIFLIKKNKLFKQKKYFYLFSLLTVISVIPAAITLNDYHLIRTYTLLFSYLCFIALGIDFIIKKPFPFLILLSFYLLSFISFWDYYLVHFTKQRDEWLFYPSKAVAQTVLQNLSQYEQIIVDPHFGKQGPYTQGIPDIYVLFYGQINPHLLWQSSPSDISKITYRHIEWNLDKDLKNTLLIGSPWSLPSKDIQEKFIKKVLLFNDGSRAYLVVDTNNE